METFADQAVIAIENVRLFEAEQQRTRELSESLEQQTATADVLRVISSSPGELEPVFQAMLENATRICEAKFGVLNALREWGVANGRNARMFRLLSPNRLQNQRGGVSTDTGQPTRSRHTHKAVECLPPIMLLKSAPGRASHRLGGARSTVCVPMIKEGELIGTITIYRQEVRPFTDKQIELAQELCRPGRHRHREHAAT